MNHNLSPTPFASENIEFDQISRAIVWRDDNKRNYLGRLFDQKDTVLPIKVLAHRKGMQIGVSEDGFGDTVIIRTQSGQMIALTEGFCLDQNGTVHKLPVVQAPDRAGYVQPEVPNIVIGQPWSPVEGAPLSDDPVVAVYIDFNRETKIDISQSSLVAPPPFDEMHEKIMDLSAQLQVSV